MRTKWHCYIWRGVLRDYTDGIAFAVARSVEEARAEIVRRANDWEKDAVAREIGAIPPDVYDLPAGGHCWGGG